MKPDEWQASLVKPLDASLDVDLADAIANARRAIVSAGSWDNLSRQDLHMILDLCLDLKAAGVGHDDAAALGHSLVPAVFAWVANGELAKYATSSKDNEDEPDGNESPELTQKDFLSSLVYFPNAMPAAVNAQAILALVGLAHGTAEASLFQPAKPTKDEDLARWLEKALWIWIAHTSAQTGHTSDWAEGHIAALVGRTRSAVRHWRLEVVMDLRRVEQPA